MKEVIELNTKDLPEVELKPLMSVLSMVDKGAFMALYTGKPLMKDVVHIYTRFKIGAYENLISQELLDKIIVILSDILTLNKFNVEDLNSRIHDKRLLIKPHIKKAKDKIIRAQEKAKQPGKEPKVKNDIAPDKETEEKEIEEKEEETATKRVSKAKGRPRKRLS